jgi:hypothetical protein
MRKLHFPSELGSIIVLVLFPVSLGRLATSASLPSIPFFPSKMFSRVRPRRRGEAQSRPKERIQGKLPPMTPSSEELESFRWTLIGMYLCIVGGICLLLAVHVHIHRPLPHER